MKSRSSSWKEKVDPAFDIIIRKYLKFFDSVEMISNTGWLVLNEEYLKNFCKAQHGWILSTLGRTKSEIDSLVNKLSKMAKIRYLEV